MPRIELAILRQTAVLWPKAGIDSYGQPIVKDTPCEIRCRWEETRTESLDPDGNTIMLDASVYVDRRIEVGSILWLGLLEEWQGSTNATDRVTPSRLMEVKTYKEIPDDKGRSSKKWVGLVRYKDTLPTYG